MFKISASVVTISCQIFINLLLTNVNEFQLNIRIICYKIYTFMNFMYYLNAFIAF